MRKKFQVNYNTSIYKSTTVFFVIKFRDTIFLQIMKPVIKFRDTILLQIMKPSDLHCPAMYIYAVDNRY